MGFKAEGLCEALDYDFSPFVDAKGTIDEPMDGQLAAFSEAWRKEIIDSAGEVGATSIDDLAKMDRDQVLEILQAVDPEKTKATLRRQAEIYSALCSHHPSAAQIMKLPPRYRIKFYRWLTEKVVNPEAATGGGNGQVLTLPSAVAG